MEDNDLADPPFLPVFVLQSGETRFSLEATELIRCLRVASAEGILPPVPSEWWGSLPLGLRDNAPTMAAPMVTSVTNANPATVEALVEDTCSHHGIHAYFIARLEQGGTLALDLPAVLQCLWLAQSQGAFPPLSVRWWTLIAMYHGSS